MGKHTKKLQHPIDAISLLEADHQTIRELFQHYTTVTDQNAKLQIARQVFQELELHAQMEEHIFYPALAGVGTWSSCELIQKGMTEHEAVRNLILELLELGLDEEAFEATFCTLRVMVEQHIQDEEHWLLPVAQDELGAQVEDLMDEMLEVKQQLLR